MEARITVVVAGDLVTRQSGQSMRLAERAGVERL